MSVARVRVLKLSSFLCLSDLDPGPQPHARVTNADSRKTRFPPRLPIRMAQHHHRGPATRYIYAIMFPVTLVRDHAIALSTSTSPSRMAHGYDERSLAAVP